MIRYSLVLLFCLVSMALAQAQFVTVPNTIRTPGGNIAINQRIYMPIHYANSPSNPKFDFVVTLKNDSVLTFSSKVNAEDKKMYLEQRVKKQKRKIFPDETKSIIGISDNWGKIPGIPADSCWLFKIYTRAINCYSSVPVMDAELAIAIQYGDQAPIVPLTKKNLEAITGTDDKKIVKWLAKDKLAKVIEYYNEKMLVK